MLKQRGMSLVELMFALAIGVVISTALGGIFVTTTKAKQEVDRNGEQIENGRIAMDWLSQDIRLAGYWDSMEYPTLSDPGALPDLCATDVTALKAAVPIYIQGLDNVAASTITGLTCLADVKAGTDIVVVRRAGTCHTTATNCEVAQVVAPFFQASKCTPPATKNDGTAGVVALGAELGSVAPADWYAVGATVGAMTQHQRDCGNAGLAGAPNYAEIRRYINRIYFIANNDASGDGLPSLKMAELRGTAWTITTIASGIEQMHIEYGLDTAGDTSADSFSTAPTTVAGWRGVVSAKINLLSRNSTASPDYRQTDKTYTLGRKADGTSNDFGPFTDKIRRHSFSGLVGLRNPVGLRGG